MDVCSRCGAFVCLECVTSVAATVLCAACAARRARAAPDRLGAEVVRAILLAASGFLVPVLGLAGAGVAAWLLRRGARGRLSPKAEDALRIALRVGLIGALTSAILWLTWGARLLLRALE